MEFEADGARRAGWRAARSARTAARAVTVLCLPGGGGPELARQLRRLAAEDRERPMAVRLVVVATVVDCVPVLIGDPMSGVFWPFAFPGRDATAVREEAKRRARHLWWQLWELGIDASCAVAEGSPAAVLAAEAAEPEVEVVVLAAERARRGRTAVRELTRRARKAHVDWRVALDVPVRARSARRAGRLV
jgi:hypothetical protein